MSHQNRSAAHLQRPALDSIAAVTAAASPGETGQTAAAVPTTPAITSAALYRARPPTQSLVPPSIQPRFYKQIQHSPRVNEGSATSSSSSSDTKVEQSIIIKHFVTLTREISSLRKELNETRGELKGAREELKELRDLECEIEDTKDSLVETDLDIRKLGQTIGEEVKNIRGDVGQMRDDLWQVKGVMLSDFRALREALRRLMEKIDGLDEPVGQGQQQQQQRGLQDVRDLTRELGVRLEELEGRLPAGSSAGARVLGGRRPAVLGGVMGASSGRLGRREEGLREQRNFAPTTQNRRHQAGSTARSFSPSEVDPLAALAVPVLPPSRHVRGLGQLAPPAKRLRTSSNQGANEGAGEGSTSSTRSAAEDFIARAIRGRSSDAGRLGGMRRMS